MKPLPLLLSLILALPAAAEEPSLESLARSGMEFAQGVAFGAAGGLLPLRLGRAAPAAQARPAAPEVELWVMNAEGGPVPGSERVLETATRLEFARTAPPGARLATARDPAGLRAEIERVRASGARIRRLVVTAHGASGYTTLVDDSNLRQFDGLSDAFAPGAHIELRSCSVASDRGGAAFQEDLGSTLLGRNGGTVNAARGPYVGLPGVGGCPWGTCTVTVEAGGCSRVTAGYDLAAERTALRERLAGLDQRLDGAAAGFGEERTARLRQYAQTARTAIDQEPWTMRAAVRAGERVDLYGAVLDGAQRSAQGRGAQGSGR